MSKKIFRFLSVLLAVSILFSGISLQITTAFAEQADDADATPYKAEVSEKYENLPDYRQYTQASAKTYKGIKKATKNVAVDLGTFAADGAEASVKNDVIVWEKGKGAVTFTVEVPKTALYNFEISWKAKEGGTNVRLGVMIDGEYKFDGSDEVVLSRLWKNISKKPRTDGQKNEYAQEQKEIGGFIDTVIRDFEGAVIDPYEFALEEGTHTITLVEPNQYLEIEGIRFIAPENVKSYESYNASNVKKYGKPKNLNTDIIFIEGENATRKSSNAIIPKSNNSDAGMSSWNGKKNDAYHTRINYIGGTSWQTSGTSLTWEFEVEKSGYYAIDLRYKQSDLVNGESYRWLKIDGKTPFEEAKTLGFEYGTNWEYYNVGDGEDSPYYIYLEGGKTHTISMEVTVAEMSEYFYELKKHVDTLNELYVDMVMITGESPDLNRDYDLDMQIPGFIKTLKGLSKELGNLSKSMTDGTGQASQAVASIDNMKRVVDNMIDSPYIAQQYISEYYTNYTSISSWLYDMIEMPLAIDQIQIVPYGKEYKDNDANFFQSLAFGTVRLISSFTSDYSLTGEDSNDANTIRLWVNWGQDQAAALNSLIQDSFTPNEEYWYDSDGDGKKEPIKVQVEIVNASLINGILAGNFPDVSLQMARTEPVNLGIRGALADLSDMPGFKDTIKQFQNGGDLESGAVAPYSYNGKVYALPDSQNFMLMFYRTDILEDLGLIQELGDPNEWTWDDFLYSATIIQRKNMNVYVPFTQITTSTTVNAGIGNLHLYPTLMWQHGKQIYNDEGTATQIRGKEELKVFEMWTDFYLEHDFLKEADFYNRLRVGVMPLGIAPYTTYMTLYSTAPEIRGRWGIAMVPGVEGEDGTVNRSVAGSGTGCAIIEKSDKKEQAWQFLRWWTSDETQQRYNENLQSILGMIGRTAVSNTGAFEKLSWDQDDLKILQRQWAQVKEVREVPGSYDVTRSIDQAFWAVLEDNARVKDAVTKWSKSADKEIARKLKEYPNS